MKKMTQLSVRRLIEFVYKRGSIDSRITSLENSASEGTRLHKKIQKKMPDTYLAEVPLSITIILGKEEVRIDGRADGIIRENDMITIDEIKTSERLFSDVSEEQIDLYWYQVMCYGHIVCEAEGLESIILQLTYMESTTETITRSKRVATAEELAFFFEQTLMEYEEWLIFQKKWEAIRNSSIKDLKFPYGSYRKGQRELAVATYKTILTKKKLYAEAPTGTGKTISTLFPAIKAIGEGEIDKVFYLTAKTITRQVAEDALEGMSKKKLKLKSVTLTAKDKICFLEERRCTPEHCPFANGYYDRLNEGLFDLLQQERLITREVLERYAQKYQLCPFELSLDVSIWCECVICDYNYLFDPIAYLRRFFQQEKEDYAFLVDESHNLVSRGKEMYSASLSQNRIRAVRKGISQEDKMLKNGLTQLIKVFKGFDTRCKEAGEELIQQKEPVESLLKSLYKFSEIVKEWLPKNLGSPKEQEVLSLYFEILNYLKISEMYDEYYITYMTNSNQDIVIKQFCLDPSELLSRTLEKGKAAVLFSASLSPLDYYQEVLGGGEEGLSYQLPSPFDEKNQLLLVAGHVTTTYKERHLSLEEIANLLKTLIEAKTGNYMVFFPSYAFLENVFELFKQALPEVKTLVQTIGMNEESRVDFLRSFVSNPKENLLAFCVLGGIFSEGIDLVGDRLSGVAIVGVGLPQMNKEQEMIKDYYNDKHNKGFQYAYQLPGMNKVLQAAGRVIRSAEDIGVVLLIDQRFSSLQYRQLFPPHWQHRRLVGSQEAVKLELEKFWKEKSGES